jgi:synaptojanin
MCMSLTGDLFWYGRAELKQSDHRPVLGIVDIEVMRILPEEREKVFADALESVGPPDGSVLLQVSVLSVDVSCFYRHLWSIP